MARFVPLQDVTVGQQLLVTDKEGTTSWRAVSSAEVAQPDVLQLLLGDLVLQQQSSHRVVVR